MSKQEREQMAIACCLICSLAEVMKACRVCPFKKGLEIKAQIEKEIKGDEQSIHNV